MDRKGWRLACLAGGPVRSNHGVFRDKHRPASRQSLAAVFDRRLTEHESDWRFSDVVGSLTSLAALACPIHLGAIKRAVQNARNVRVTRRYAARLARFMEERTTLPEKQYASAAHGPMTKPDSRHD